ncbi:MAG TPA: DUF4388 domain-containing protein [Anaeromyxobacteraceae bacterium]|nr:DUF4388 domain-containing protein [Anaeromyxobacteraceae bacterium]
MVRTKIGEQAEGFEGAFAGLSLPDVIQLSANNHFSGAITVECDAGVGRVFFRDGEIIHAAQGNRTGVEAFCDIMEWPTGRFGLQQNVTTASRTIHMSAQHLLIEAHQIIDERRHRRSLTTAPPQAPENTAKQSAIHALLARLRAVPGVSHITLLTKDGKCVEDNSVESEALAGQVLYLAMVAGRFGPVLNVGALQSVVLNGSTRHLLLLVARNYYLGILIAAEAEVAAVENQVRRLLAGTR